MTLHLTEHRGGFGRGITPITRFGEPDDTGIQIAVVKLGAKETHVATCEFETAWLLMQGEAFVAIRGARKAMRRASIFDDLPYCVHVAKGEALEIEAAGEVELMRFETANEARFSPLIYGPEDVRSERRGEGVLKDASFRFVRTIFDRSNAPAGSNLVLGEVINLPGRWSSYPPHHHPQPEVYHYRFSDPRGFGHAELGDSVLKVRHNDTIKIFEGADHPQCAAPGYAMYYCWVIRHLPGRPYDVPEFTEEHRWMLERGSTHWWPSESNESNESSDE